MNIWNSGLILSHCKTLAKISPKMSYSGPTDSIAIALHSPHKAGDQLVPLLAKNDDQKWKIAFPLFYVLQISVDRESPKNVTFVKVRENSIVSNLLHILDPVLSKGVLSNHPCQWSVFKFEYLYLNSSLVFSGFLHEVKAP